MAIVIPEEEGRFITYMLISEYAECCGAEPEVARLTRREAQPARGQNAEKVAMAEEDDPSAGSLEAGHDAVSPGTHGLHRLASWTAIAKQVPPWPLRANLRRRPALVAP